MESTMQYKYSIIIPHYRIPKLLRRCLCSVPKRNDLQVLVVDDNSGADIVAQIREIEKDFPFVTFIYSETNGGGGRARNIGLRNISKTKEDVGQTECMMFGTSIAISNIWYITFDKGVLRQVI